MKATRIKPVKMRGEAYLYRCEPGGSLPEYVVVSAVVAPYTGPETLIFESDANGEITSFATLEGSYRGDLDIPEALRNAGYEVEDD